jgi:hypothetical protein
MTFNLEDEEIAEVAGPRVDGNARSIQAGAKSSTTTGSGESVSDPALHPDSAMSLHNLHPLLLENGTRRTVSVWAAVLGFTPPSLTSTREWKMSIVLIDETMPLLTSVGVTSDTGKPKEMHVHPSCSRYSRKTSRGCPWFDRPGMSFFARRQISKHGTANRS